MGGLHHKSHALAQGAGVGPSEVLHDAGHLWDRWVHVQVVAKARNHGIVRVLRIDAP